MVAPVNNRVITRGRTNVVRGKPLNPNAASEARYYRALRVLILQMNRDVAKELGLFYASPTTEAYFAQDDTMAAQAKIIMEKLKLKFQAIFDIASKPIATGVASGANASSATQLKSSIKELSGVTLKTDVFTPELTNVLQATISENVSLIKSIPSEYFTQIEGAVMRSITTGRGLQDLVPFIKNHEGVTLRRARIIANDQTRKAFSNINFVRMENVGIQEYEWLHSAGGQKPRKLHERMSGNIYRIDTPPIIDERTGQRGKPGDLINCRCRAVPVIKFN